MNKNRTIKSAIIFLTSAGVATLLAASVAAAAQPPAADYHKGWQRATAGAAKINVAGTATGGSPDVQGDASLLTIQYHGGENFIHTRKPIAVSDISVSGDPTGWAVHAGSNCTYGLRDMHTSIGSDDGDPNDVSNADIEAFGTLMLQALQSKNLNNYLDCADEGTKFEFIMEFEDVVRDNSPGRDYFGEILYFERGQGNGNSWIKIQAVDENGDALGPWLVLSPSETLPTTPTITVSDRNQRLGVTTIDVSRLGVREFRYLRVSNSVEDNPQYTGGGDTGPDFRIMVMMTEHSQIAETVFD